MELEHKYGMDAKIEHKYFDLVREEFVDGKKRTIRRCKICQRDYKGTASVNSNFITHLKVSLTSGKVVVTVVFKLVEMFC